MKAFLRGKASKTKTAAVVEDDEDLTFIYSTILRSLGYNPVFVARNGEEIVRWISHEAASPAVIIMDYELPKMNGLDAAREVLRRRPGTKIIIATAHDEIAEKVARLGLSFLPKPFSMKKLVRKVEATRPGFVSRGVAGPGVSRAGKGRAAKSFRLVRRKGGTRAESSPSGPPQRQTPGFRLQIFRFIRQRTGIS
jgi:two-component system, chemotaxis family, chemotaxis protein CheY